MQGRSLHVPRSRVIRRRDHRDRDNVSVARGISAEATTGVGVVGVRRQRRGWVCELPVVLELWLLRLLAWRGDAAAVAVLFAGDDSVVAQAGSSAKYKSATQI